MAHAPALGTGELEALVETLRQVVPGPAVDDQGQDHTWQQLAEAGLTGLVVDERHGGSGLGLPELVAVQRELGRRLYAGPYLGSAVLAAGALAGEPAEPAAGELLAQIAKGRVAALVVPFTGRGTVEASGSGERRSVSGVADSVVDADVAETFVVFAESAGGPELLLVDTDEVGVKVEPLTAVDLRRRLGRVTFERAAATLVETGPGGAEQRLQAVIGLSGLAVAAESVGGAEAILERTLDYARQRVQFGRPIGAFQAIKHRCAELLVDLEYARSGLTYAASRGGESEPAFRLAAAVAKVAATEAYVKITTEAIQLHGGIGYTWEHPAHLYYRRAWSNALLFGGNAEHRRAIAGALLDAPAAASRAQV